MSDFLSLDAKECAQRILKIKKPVILMHARPDGDTVGSGIALCEIFRSLGKSPTYLCADKIPKRLEFLTRGYTATENFDGCELVAVDIASAQQAGEIFNRIPAPVLMIDHHEVGEPFADGYIAKGLSSAGEAVLNVALELCKMGKIKLTKKLAYPIYAAISSDTACFRYSSANKASYKKAAKLINTGIDFSEINHLLFNCKLPEQVKAEGFISQKIKTAFDGRVAYATVEKQEREELGIELEFFETAVDVVRSIYGVELAFIIKESDTHEWRASLRSTGADVAKLAAALGGGGHTRAAGCSPRASSADEAVNMILALIKELKIL